MKRLEKILFCLIFIFATAFGMVGCDSGNSIDPPKPAIGVSWRADNNPGSYLCTSISAGGGIPVLLDQVHSEVASGSDDETPLNEESAKALKESSVSQSNIHDVLFDESGKMRVSAIVFPGGEDISPNLMLSPQPSQNNGEAYCSQQDISDYLLMRFCLENNIPVLAICRGMQMLSIISGGSIIQDIPSYCKQKGIEYSYIHRGKNSASTFHDVQLNMNTTLYRIIGQGSINGVVSSHHQGFTDLSGTPLRVSAVNTDSGLNMIEAVERTDKTFIIGVQFHPEVTCGKCLQQNQFTETYAPCIKLFESLVQAAS